ncbi:MAG: LacI family DNA-binding transcriptional regulator [Clostridia bacterium]|jgi:LacI family transcriptional regulator
MTVKEIAELAGVSIGTVDRVLHSRGRVSSETRTKIQTIIERSGFTPNPIARSLRRNKPYRFYAVLPRKDEDSGYWGLANQGIREAADELMHFGVRTSILDFDRYDPVSFRSTLAKARKENPDGLLLPPVLPSESRGFMESIEGTVPFVFFDADLPGCQPVCTIGQDPYKAGFLAGRLVYLLAGGYPLPAGRGVQTAGTGGRPASFAVLSAHSEDYHIRCRQDGFMAYLDSVGARGLLREGVDLEQDEAAAASLSALLSDQPELRGIFVTSASAHRLAKARKQLRYRKPFVLVGFDLVPANQRMLAEGGIDAIISQRPQEQGRQGLLSLYRAIVLGRPVAPRIEMPLDIYLKENAPPMDEEHTTETTQEVHV